MLSGSAEWRTGADLRPSLLVKGDAPWRDVAALVAEARAGPETLTFGSAGADSVQHIQAEQFCVANASAPFMFPTAAARRS